MNIAGTLWCSMTNICNPSVSCASILSRTFRPWEASSVSRHPCRPKQPALSSFIELIFSAPVRTEVHPQDGRAKALFVQTPPDGDAGRAHVTLIFERPAVRRCIHSGISGGWTNIAFARSGNTAYRGYPVHLCRRHSPAGGRALVHSIIEQLKLRGLQA